MTHRFHGILWLSSGKADWLSRSHDVEWTNRGDFDPSGDGGLPKESRRRILGGVEKRNREGCGLWSMGSPLRTLRRFLFRPHCPRQHMAALYSGTNESAYYPAARAKFSRSIKLSKTKYTKRFSTELKKQRNVLRKVAYGTISRNLC